jgi:hypothetical protein
MYLQMSAGGGIDPDPGPPQGIGICDSLATTFLLFLLSRKRQKRVWIIHKKLPQFLRREMGLHNIQSDEEVVPGIEAPFQRNVPGAVPRAGTGNHR